MRRRDFLKRAGLVAGAPALSQLARAVGNRGAVRERPNVLWISVEDISPDLGCYGDAYAVTPNLDRFAAEGVRYDACFAHMGVCAPARSGIITGMYPTHIGTNHMRCKGVPPAAVRCFTEYLRTAGYCCTNRSKTDYQFDSPVTAWDKCGNCKDWRERAEGQPFFSVINVGSTHESQIRNMKRREQLPSLLSAEEKHEPAKAVLPPYYPDTPTVRADWAQYYDIITQMDKDVARILQQLEEGGLAEDTIVWFWGDHGRGLPRGKRWIYDSGLRVPLMIRVPAKWRRWARPDQPDAVKPGVVDTGLVAFVDFAPTMLSLCGVSIPGHIQGQAFLGPRRPEPRQYIYGARDRVDEAYDMIRCVRDKRFKYIRNFMPHLPRSLDINFMNQMPTMKEMRRLYAEGKLEGAQLQYFEHPKPLEELYDTLADPHEVVNLAGDPAQRRTLARLRNELFRWMQEMGDFGVLPECEFDALKRPGDQFETVARPGVTATRRDGALSVQVVCATSGASIAYRVSGGKDAPAAEGTFLSVMDAEQHGKGAKRGRGKVFGWRDRNTWFSWPVKLERAGRIPVHVSQAYARREPGRTYTLSVGDAQLKGTVQRTSGWDDFKFVKVGEVDIPAPGPCTVSIKPDPGKDPYSMDLRFVVLDGRNLENLKPEGSWQLYSKPLTLWPGQVLTVKACRLGFKDSEAVRYRVGDPGIPAQTDEARAHWRRAVDASGLVERALALKAVEGQGDTWLAACVAALRGAQRDSAGSVRYWAVVGLHHSVPKADRERYVPMLRDCLSDSSHAVRIAAAQALCDWDADASALGVLVKGLEHELASGRLLAATALNRLGRKALPVLDVLKQHKAGYVGRMCQTTVERLTAGSDG